MTGADTPAASANEPRVATRTVALVGFEGLQLLDLTGPVEVFSQATRLLQEEGDARTPAYRVIFSAPERGRVASSSGLSLLCECARRELPETDTLLVVGGAGTWRASEDETLLDWLRERAHQSRRFGSVCTGALVLGRAGLLDGRRATTHWQYIGELARLVPTARVSPEAIFVQDGNLWTSAGVLAGMDMALAMVEQDWGKSLALEVARRLVMYQQRAGSAAQRSTALEAQAAAAEGRFRQLADWIPHHLAEDLSVPRLAARFDMSPRHFARCFREELGVTPAKFIEQLRFEAARQALGEGSASVEDVAGRCGFGCAETLRRVFQRRLGMGPSAYRRQAREGQHGTT